MNAFLFSIGIVATMQFGLITSPATSTIQQMINRSAEQYGVASTTLDAVLNCESMKNPDAIGDHGESRGISQINSRYHPEVTDEQAFDPEWSIDWTARRISEGEGHEWMCFRMLELSTDEDLQTL